MWPCGSHKHRTLSQSVLAGDMGAVRRMLARGADPNQCDPDDDACPIHYAVHHGPAMIQLLIDHGADVNRPARGSMPLALAEAAGYAEVARLLRKAGARVRSGTEELSLDPRLQIQLEPKISMLAITVHHLFPEQGPEFWAKRVEEKLDLQFPTYMPHQEQERIRKDVRALIRKKCGVKEDLVSEGHVPRTWENLPSMVMSVVPPVFTYAHLVWSITEQAPDKQLVCLVRVGSTASQDEAARRINLLYEFSDDPRLVLMRFVSHTGAQEQMIVRASFMRETASQVAASNLSDLAERLSELAREKGLHTTMAG